MIVLGADTHKRSHTVAAVAAATGELVGEQTVGVERRGFAGLLRWARALDGERVWALEDCRSLERFLVERGERVLGIPTHVTAKGSRARNCVARASSRSSSTGSNARSPSSCSGSRGSSSMSPASGR
jgi:hypothetical protein